GRRWRRRLEGRRTPCFPASEDGRLEGLLLGERAEGLGHRRLPARPGHGGLGMDGGGPADGGVPRTDFGSSVIRDTRKHRRRAYAPDARGRRTGSRVCARTHEKLAHAIRYLTSC